MKKLITVALSLMFVVCLSYTVIAGSLDSPGAPSAGSGMYTLQNLYDYLTSGTALTVQSSFQEPTSGPGSTMKSTKEIGDTIAGKFNLCAATADNVEQGVTFFCTQAGSWGVQTGTLSALPRPTATPTITPTPTQTPTWVCGSTFVDSRDGKSYNTVLIGTQCWMKKNMDYNVNGCLSIAFTGSDNGACSYYTGGPFTDHGLLYQWSAARVACPSGWHNPTLGEWQTLEGVVGNSTFGKHLKTTAGGGDDSVGFSMLLPGFRGDGPDDYHQLNNEAILTYPSSPETVVGIWVVSAGSDGVVKAGDNSNFKGFPLRCIK